MEEKERQANPKDDLHAFQRAKAALIKRQTEGNTTEAEVLRWKWMDGCWWRALCEMHNIITVWAFAIGILTASLRGTLTGKHNQLDRSKYCTEHGS